MQEQLLKLSYELMGIQADIESGQSFDEICMGTLKYVIVELQKLSKENS